MYIKDVSVYQYTITSNTDKKILTFFLFEVTTISKLFGHISAVAPPNRPSWITNQ